MNELRAIDVCAGAGGWAVAARGLPINIVAAFDREADALKTYALNHPGTETILCDVVTHNFAKWKGIDLILGGIPCEQVSAFRAIHKTKSPEIDGLAKLITRCLSLPKLLRAPHWCFEDVCQLEKHLPILTPHFIVESASFSPQRRRRMFVGSLPCPNGGADERVLEHALRRGPYRIGGRLYGRTPSVNFNNKPRSFYPWMPHKKSPTVFTLNSRRDAEGAVKFREHWRQLEWQELAALQGFPDDYIFCGSPSRVTKMIAQAVQIDTARAILSNFVRHTCAGVVKDETA
jgi:site-specific DNA-cytosine methylase